MLWVYACNVAVTRWVKKSMTHLVQYLDVANFLSYIIYSTVGIIMDSRFVKVVFGLVELFVVGFHNCYNCSPPSEDELLFLENCSDLYVFLV